MICPKCKKEIENLEFEETIIGYYDLVNDEYIQTDSVEDSQVFCCPECNVKLTIEEVNEFNKKVV
jgi:predicted  nucleic acid-binding Zn ribbon protein